MENFEEGELSQGVEGFVTSWLHKNDLVGIKRLKTTTITLYYT